MHGLMKCFQPVESAGFFVDRPGNPKETRTGVSQAAQGNAMATIRRNSHQPPVLTAAQCREPPRLAPFQCPSCLSRLENSPTGPRCTGCGTRYALIDGSIIDFVGGRFDTKLDPHQYDSGHGINDRRSAAEYRHIRRLAGERWPASLGRMLEIGCGTGAFSRAVLADNAAQEAVLTDVSRDMLRICKAHLDRLGVGARVPMTLATYSTNERCFRDASFDSCVGIQVLHHLPDYEAFLEDLFRFLKPGGIAFFAEPALRFHQALAAGIADIVARQMAADPTPSHDRQLLHNWIGEQRRGTLHQGALWYLAGLEDKHMFVPDSFAATAQRIGFASAEAFPLAPDPAGSRMAVGLFGELGLSPEGTAAVLEQLPRHTKPYFKALPAADRTPSYLFWLRKPLRRAARPRKTGAATQAARPAAVVNVLPAHWFLELRAQPDAAGLAIDVEGWCLLNSDIKWLRIQVCGVERDMPVWYPRADVHGAFNQDGTYAAWNSLCCGVTGRVMFEGVPAAAEELPIGMRLVLTNGFALDLPVQRFRPGQPLFLKL